MGIIITKFRKNKSTEEKLEKLDKEIKTIEIYRVNTEQTQKKIVGRFLLISVIVYSVTAFLFYFYFFPASFYDRLFYIIPLIFAPIIIISTKKGLTWYYKRKISRNQTKLRNLNEEKKKILENVMETETYKKAKTILEKYAPEQMKRNSFPVPSFDATPAKNNSVTTIAPTSGLRQRVLTSSQTTAISKTPYVGFKTPLRPPQSQNVARISSTSMGSTVSLPVPTTTFSGTPLPLPRAILPRDRSVLDKMVEYLVGDGPSNRYALICKQCSSHNGMALKEEYEYLSFRCCYCYTFNPSRKKRPPAPKLEIESKPLLSVEGPSTSESEKNSSSDTDSEQETKTLPGGSVLLSCSENLETLYPKEKEPSSDSEKNDFDKLSDAEFKNSDSEATPMDVDNVSNEEMHQDIQIEANKESEHKNEVKDEL